MTAPDEVVAKFHDLKQHWHLQTRTAEEQADIGADMSVAVLAAFSRWHADRAAATAPDEPPSDH
ncbi:hypothetical protein [Streptacidiphilus anmyonensis]|uniref:hypothetical protein n=1 Tax=Streptacidiphilus anmyonensis TaxID=405782 RepID=UPI0005AACC5D|nr:hypothetical protein [Streptacidiphilus anmyonensis]